MRRALAAAAATLLLAACTGRGTPGGGSTPEPLPLIVTDPCPAPDALLTAQPPRGQRLPDVELPCLGHASSVRMRAVGGKPYVVNLWASWCGPCKDEMPEFQRVYLDLKDRVGFLGVDTKDREPNARKIVQNTAISYPSVVDESARVQLELSVRSLPATALVGADGVVKTVHVGQLTAGELRDLLAKHLGVR